MGRLRTDKVPRDSSFDASVAFVREGYPFIRNRARRYGTDIFRTRLMLRPVICVTGPEAADMFYTRDRFTRKGAMPWIALTLLQDNGSVQMLDGREHTRRKQLFLTLTASQDQIERLVKLMREAWRSRIHEWQRRGRVTLFPEIEQILCQSVCDWAGVPLEEAETSRKTSWFSAMIEGSGSIGLRHWRGQHLRRKAEDWIACLIRRFRSGRLPVSERSALAMIALHRDIDGDYLTEDVAAVELLNILRPVVASARFILFAAVSLHQYPAAAAALRSGRELELENFTQEVRRLCPFFPCIGGRVLSAFEWRGHMFEEGDWVALDIFGTNRDPRGWQSPDAFDPSRFGHDWDGSSAFIPQGGGGYLDGHRCPGERLAIELTKTALSLLTREMKYNVPSQDLTVNLSRIPAIPKSRLVIDGVEPA
jgi:fatty-acid peroxygenase